MLRIGTRHVQLVTCETLSILENPHHFVVVRVDGDQLSLEVVGTGETTYTPYPGGLAKVSLIDRRSGSQ